MCAFDGPQVLVPVDFPATLIQKKGVIDAGGAANCSGLDNSEDRGAATNSQLWFSQLAIQSCGKTWEADSVLSVLYFYGSLL